MGKDLKGKELGKGITQRKDGRYQARIFTKDQKTTTIYNTDLKALKEEKLKLEYEIKYGIAVDFTSMTVDEWFNEWMNLYNLNLKNTSLSNYTLNYNRAAKYIGHLKIKDIKMSNVQSLINNLQLEGYAYSTILSVKNVLFGMFSKAAQNDYVQKNPCVGVVMPPDETVKAKALSREEVDKFFNAIVRQRYRDLFYILLNTGMRIGEACALEWTDVDFENKKIAIYKTLNRTKQWSRAGRKLTEKRFRVQVTSPKKDASYRNIPLSADVEIAFKRWKRIQDEDKLKYGRDWGCKNELLGEYPELIFTTSTGGILSPSDAWYYCQQGVNRVNEVEIIDAEVEGREPDLLEIHPHTLRHTFATNCLQSGMNPLSVQKIMGHASLDMLMHYTHPEDEFVQEEFDKYTEKYGKEKYVETVTGVHTDFKVIDFETRLHKKSV